MRTIYVDSNFKCHVINDGTMTSVETEYFEGKCDAYIEGYCCKDDQFYPCVSIAELEAAQQEYENARLADMENALAILYGGVPV